MLLTEIQQCFCGVPAFGSGTDCKRIAKSPPQFTQNQPIGNASRAPALMVWRPAKPGVVWVMRRGEEDMRYLFASFVVSLLLCASASLPAAAQSYGDAAERWSEIGRAHV